MSTKLTSPSVYHPVPELHQGVAIGRDSVIPEVSADDLFEPFPRLADRLVHPLTQFLLSVQLRTTALATIAVTQLLRRIRQ